MLAAGLCHVTGFEPQEEALQKLQLKKGPNEQYLPYAVGDGSAHTLNICAKSGMTSLLEPDLATLALFDALRRSATSPGESVWRPADSTISPKYAISIFSRSTCKAASSAVFRGGTQKLSRAVAVQTEVSFVTLYRNQPTLGDVDLEMRRQEFIPHCLAAVKKWPIAPCVVNGNPPSSPAPAARTDIVYVRDFARPQSMSDEQLKHLALIAHHCYGSFRSRAALRDAAGDGGRLEPARRTDTPALGGEVALPVELPSMRPSSIPTALFSL